MHAQTTSGATHGLSCCRRVPHAETCHLRSHACAQKFFTKTVSRPSVWTTRKTEEAKAHKKFALASMHERSLDKCVARAVRRGATWSVPRLQARQLPHMPTHTRYGGQVTQPSLTAIRGRLRRLRCCGCHCHRGMQCCGCHTHCHRGCLRCCGTCGCHCHGFGLLLFCLGLGLLLRLLFATFEHLALQALMTAPTFT